VSSEGIASRPLRMSETRKCEGAKSGLCVGRGLILTDGLWCPRSWRTSGHLQHDGAVALPVRRLFDSYIKASTSFSSVGNGRYSSLYGFVHYSAGWLYSFIWWPFHAYLHLVHAMQ
jgi:hypothetical protein